MKIMSSANLGFTIMNKDNINISIPRTAICVGMGRSGTSAIASMMKYLGIFIGDQLQPMYLENSVLANLIVNDKLDEAAILIKNYDLQFDIWGIKRPNLRDHFNKLHLFRNPMLIITHRDVLGISLRNEIALSDVVCDIAELRRCLKFYTRFMDALENIQAPQFHVSFSAIEKSPEKVLKALADFLGVPIPKGDFIAHQQEHHKNYLRT